MSLGSKFVVHLIWYGYTRTFTHDFMEEHLYKAGFTRVDRCAYRETRSPYPGIVELDNREEESLLSRRTNTGRSRDTVGAPGEHTHRVARGLGGSPEPSLGYPAPHLRAETPALDLQHELRHRRAGRTPRRRHELAATLQGP